MSTFLDKIKTVVQFMQLVKRCIRSHKIEETIREAVKHSPSAFNSQSSRVVTLYGESHAKFWNLVREALRKIVPAEAFAGTNAKIDSFVAGVGTVLFYEDQAVVKSLQEQFELYADNFPVWSEHSCNCSICNLDCAFRAWFRCIFTAL